jgi:ribosomal protein S12 methylthiotransferase accessory factor
LATSVEEAVLKGILELIERDAVMIRWYARLAPPRLDINPADLLPERIGSQAEGLEIRCHDLTIDGEVPVAGVTCIERTGRPCFFLLSAACAPDMWTAASKALVEAGQGRPFIKSMAGNSAVAIEETGFNDFDSNVRFYGEPSNAQYAEWFIQNPNISARNSVDAPEIKTPVESLRILLGRCLTMGINPIAFDLSTPEIHDAGLFACRLFAPELAPLGIPSAPFLGHPRLARFVASSRAAGTAPKIPDWVPHPFP